MAAKAGLFFQVREILYLAQDGTELALSKVRAMSVTFPTAHLSSPSPRYTLVDENALPSDTTLDTSHFPRSTFMVWAFENVSTRDVTEVWGYGGGGWY